jgi:hypothetical protein
MIWSSYALNKLTLKRQSETASFECWLQSGSHTRVNQKWSIISCKILINLTVSRNRFLTQKDSSRIHLTRHQRFIISKKRERETV